VDDELVTRLAVAESLEDLGNVYTVEPANSGDEGWAKIRKANYSVVVIDCEVPGMSGLKLAKAVREFSPDTAVVLMAAHGTAELRETVLRQGIAGYVDKPFTMHQMREIIERAVGRADNRGAQHYHAQSVSPLVRAGAGAPPADAGAHPVQPSMHRLLEVLLADTRARCVLLMTSAGYAVDAVGRTRDLHVPIVDALITANFAAAAELARLLGNRSDFKASHHHGPDCNIYTHRVNKDLLLAVVFGPESTSGAVWLFAKRAADALASVFPDQPSTVKFGGDLATPIEAELDQLFDTRRQ